MAKSNPYKYNTVMLVDDNDIDNLINQKMIEMSGLSKYVLVHTGAKSSLEFLKNIEKLTLDDSYFIPDIIFLDIDMPIMDGFQYLDEFDKLSIVIKGKCKIIMLTSSLSPYDLTKASKNEQVVKFFNKPLTSENLQEIKNL